MIENQWISKIMTSSRWRLTENWKIFNREVRNKKGSSTAWDVSRLILFEVFERRTTASADIFFSKIEMMCWESRSSAFIVFWTLWLMVFSMSLQTSSIWFMHLDVCNESKYSTVRWSNFDRRDRKMGAFLLSTEATPCGHLLKWKLPPKKIGILQEHGFKELTLVFFESLF